MRALKLLSVLALAAIAGLVFVPKEALAAFAPSRILNLYVLNKLLVGNGTEANAITEVLAGPAAGTTIDFTTLASGVQFSSAITVTGATVGDVCEVGAPAAASALKATFSCVVTATNEVKVIFEPKDTAKNTTTLVSASPSVATVGVPVASICNCTPVGADATIAGAGCATTVVLDAGLGFLTMTGPDTVTTTMTYDCAAPVDPASGAYFVRVFSQQ